MTMALRYVVMPLQCLTAELKLRGVMTVL